MITWRLVVLNLVEVVYYRKIDLNGDGNTSSGASLKTDQLKKKV